MTFKSATQPHCRCCAKPLKKDTVEYMFGRRYNHLSSAWTKYFPDKPKTFEEALAFAPAGSQIVSKKWDRSDKNDVFVDAIRVWDGKSYDDEFFCTMRCAASIGRDAAAAGWATAKYRNTVKEA